MVPEARLEQTEGGLVPGGEGWFVMNAREARWKQPPDEGLRFPSTVGRTEYFPQVGIALFVLGPGEPIGMYHWEADQEDFLVLSGEALLLIEGKNGCCGSGTSSTARPGPSTSSSAPETGLAPCSPSVRGSIRTLTWGAYTVDQAALRHGAGVEQETTEAEVAYAQVPNREPTPYREGWLPGD